MKKSIFILASSVIMSGTIFTSCDTPKDEVINAQENVTEANDNLKEATEDYIADIEKFRIETNKTIDENDKYIADLKANVAGKSAATKAVYWNEIAELEKKNGELSMRLVEYKADGKDNWGKFKAEFNHDMEGLNKAFKDITVKNQK